MTEPNSPVWTLAGYTADTVWAAPRGLSIPVLVTIDADEDVTAGPHPTPDATTVRLSPTLNGLTEDTVQHLLELLAGIHGIHPPDVRISAHDEVSVPLLVPSTITNDQVEWTITDQLSLVHADRRDIYFAVGDENLGTTPEVELTAAHAWLLVRALTTIRCWQFQLEAASHAAATNLRISLLAAGSTATGTAGASRATAGA